jgi:hypothetical protein
MSRLRFAHSAGSPSLFIAVDIRLAVQTTIDEIRLIILIRSGWDAEGGSPTPNADFLLHSSRCLWSGTRWRQTCPSFGTGLQLATFKRGVVMLGARCG